MLKKICGIYVIKNLVNNKVYIGQAENVYGRWGIHIKELVFGIHINNHLQKAWDKYGEDKFEFSILERCEVSELDTKEIKFVADFKSSDERYGYNKTEGGAGRRGFKVSDETKHKISIKAKIRGADLEERKRRSKRCKKQHTERRIGTRFKQELREAICSKCWSHFYQYRKNNGQFEQNKLCTECRESYVRHCMPKGFKQSAEAVDKIAKASRRMWELKKEQERRRLFEH
jgi:group I intron endonuclease